MRKCRQELTFQQQFPGIQGLPTAPTPPPAAPSSVASYPSYTGGYQSAYPQGGFQQGGHQQSAFPQRPAPLGQSETQHNPQSAYPPSGHTGYGQLQSNYGSQQPPLAGYNTNFQQTDPMPPHSGQYGGEIASRGAMVPTSRNFSGEIVESRRRSSEIYHYEQYGHPPQGAAVPPPQAGISTMPVLLCHTCSVCDQMRSAGYHRNNPVVPGRALVLTPCRRCKKKTKSQQRSRSSFTRVWSCTAQEPCDWPGESVRVDLERNDRRGRRHRREEVHVYRHSPSRPRIVRRTSSQIRLGLRAVQHLQDLPRVLRNDTNVRVSSLSPRRASRYDEIWPPPDVVRTTPSQPEVQHVPGSNPNMTSRDEVWPPPDVVPTHPYRKSAPTPLRRQSSRIIELSSSPPPSRRRPERVVYRSESVERRPRSVSPVRVSFRDDRRNEEAEARLMSHPRPYRPVVPDHRSSRVSEETASTSDYMPRGRQDPPGRSILTATAGEHETSRRRMSMHESQQSTRVEVDGHRVHFGPKLREEPPAPAGRGRPLYGDDASRSGEDYTLYHNYARQRVVDDPLPPPPIEEMERVRIRRASVSPCRSYEKDIRIDRARRLSPSPAPPPRPYEATSTRRLSPLPSRDRERTPQPPRSPLPERRPYSGYRHVSREEALARPRSFTPPPPRRPASDDMTDSDSAHSGEVTEVRSWRGIDENGQPATFVEERKTVQRLEQGSDRGEFRPLTKKMASRSWRDV
jgi:hypothetical protein